MKMLNGYILVKADQQEDKTTFGLLIPDKHSRLPNTGVVTDVAEGVETVSVGDKVAFLRYAALDAPFEDKDLRLCKERHIIAHAPAGT